MGAGGIDPVFVAVLAIIVFLVLIADFVIFCYWFTFKYKEYSFQQMYGPVLKFPPRESEQLPDYAPRPTLEMDPYAADDAIPNTQYPIPESTTPNAQRPTPNAEYPIPETTTPDSVPAFDFMPPVAIDDMVASEQSNEPTATPDADLLANTLYPTPDDPEPNTEHRTPNTEYPIPDDPATPNAQHPTPNAANDVFEDTRPINPVLLIAQGGVRSPFAATWSLVHPFIGIQVVLLVVNVLSTIALIPVFPMMMSDPNGIMKLPYVMAVTIVGLFIQNVGFVGLTAYLMKGYGTSLKRIGLRMPSRREVCLGLGYGALLCIAAMMLEKGMNTVASHLLSRQFIDRMDKITDKVAAGGMFEHIHSVPLQIWFILAGAVAAPIGEEVFFRGLLYNGLKKRWGVTAGVIVSGICFGLIHFAPEAIVIIIPMGCILAIVYERTKSLWVTILMHAVNNGAQLIIAMYAMIHVAGDK